MLCGSYKLLNHFSKRANECGYYGKHRGDKHCVAWGECNAVFAVSLRRLKVRGCSHIPYSINGRGHRRQDRPAPAGLSLPIAFLRGPQAPRSHACASRVRSFNFSLCADCAVTNITSNVSVE